MKQNLLFHQIFVCNTKDRAIDVLHAKPTSIAFTSAQLANEFCDKMNANTQDKIYFTRATFVNVYSDLNEITKPEEHDIY